MKKNIVTIGGGGLVGSRVNYLLSKNYNIKNFSRSSGLDISNPKTLNILNQEKYENLIVYAAKTDVDSCEADKVKNKTGQAYKVNVKGVENVLSAIKDQNKKITLISTDFVFSGNDTPTGGYTEQSRPNPVNWYGQTKYLAEQLVQKSNNPYIILRISYPFLKKNSDNMSPKKDLLQILKSRLESNMEVKAVTDHVMTPTLIDDISLVIDKLISEDKQGTYHATGDQSISPYEAALLIAEKHHFDKSLINKTTRADFFKERAPRPFNLKMNNGKIRELGLKMTKFEDSIC